MPSPKGAGSWRKRPSGILEYRVSLGQDDRGRRMRLATFGRTKREAVEKMAVKLRKVERHGGLVVDDGTTLAMFLRSWIERRRAERDTGAIARATSDAYDGALRRHVLAKSESAVNAAVAQGADKGIGHALVAIDAGINAAEALLK